MSKIFTEKFSNSLLVAKAANNQLWIRGLKELPIKWVRPAKVPWHLKTGDRITKTEVDMNQGPILCEQSNELNTANDLVKKLFTFHFLGRKYAMKRAKQELIELLRNHNYDTNSMEIKIVKNTMDIRNFLEQYQKFPYHRKQNDILNKAIIQRKRNLRQLREWDYRKFEWLLEKLQLDYKPIPKEYETVERKKSIRRLADKYCEDVKARKMNEYRMILEKEKEIFLHDKVKYLQWIKEEEIACNVEPTVTDEQIEEAKQKLKEFMDNKVVEETKEDSPFLNVT